MNKQRQNAANFIESELRRVKPESHDDIAAFEWIDQLQDTFEKVCDAKTVDELKTLVDSLGLLKTESIDKILSI